MPSPFNGFAGKRPFSLEWDSMSPKRACNNDARAPAPLNAGVATVVNGLATTSKRAALQEVKEDRKRQAPSSCVSGGRREKVQQAKNARDESEHVENATPSKYLSENIVPRAECDPAADGTPKPIQEPIPASYQLSNVSQTIPASQQQEAVTAGPVEVDPSPTAPEASKYKSSSWDDCHEWSRLFSDLRIDGSRSSQRSDPVYAAMSSNRQPPRTQAASSTSGSAGLTGLHRQQQKLFSENMLEHFVDRTSQP